METTKSIADAGLAAIGGGTVIENAEEWPAQLSAAAQMVIVTLSDTIRLAQQLRRAVIRQNQEPITRDEAKRLNARMITQAGTAYRLLRIAIGDPMFKPEKLSDAEADQEIDQEIIDRMLEE